MFVVCLRCGSADSLDKPATAVCCATVLDEAERGRPEARRFALWTLFLCRECLSLALRESLVIQRASDYEVMKYAPVVLIVGAAYLWFGFFYADQDPDDNLEVFIFILLTILSMGAIAFGMYMGPYAAHTFHKASRRLGSTVTSSSDKDRLDAYSREADRIHSASIEGGSNADTNQAIYGDFPIPTVTQKGKPWSGVIAVGVTDKDILRSAKSIDATYAPAVRELLSERAEKKHG